MSIRQQGWKQTTPHFRRVSINRAMCLRSVQKGLKESHSSIVFSLDICKKKRLKYGAEVCTVVLKMSGKNTTISLYIVLRLPPGEAFAYKGCFTLFFFVLFLVWVKKWLELLLEARWRVLKLDICTNVSVSLCVFSLCLLILSWHLMRWSLFFFSLPTRKPLIHSRWGYIFEPQERLMWMVDDWQLGNYKRYGCSEGGTLTMEIHAMMITMEIRFFRK